MLTPRRSQCPRAESTGTWSPSQTNRFVDYRLASVLIITHYLINWCIMSSDVLTQLQTCYDQLLTQFFSTVSYLTLRHPLIFPETIPGDPYTQPSKEDTLRDGARHRYSSLRLHEEDISMGLQPVPPTDFDHAQKDLADDLVRKGQQIEYLIRNLPGLGRGEEQQAKEIQELVVKVAEMESVRKQTRREMRECVRQLDDLVLGMSTSIKPGNGQSLPIRNGNADGG